MFLPHTPLDYPHIYPAHHFLSTLFLATTLYLASLCTFNGCHALAGFLPVVPGPCGLFRASNVTPGILARVRAICGSQPSEDGLVVANLKIAEDRILSYLLVLVEGPGGRTAETHWVPSTTFFFESEGTLKEFVLQRRRWLNGTTAG